MITVLVFAGFTDTAYCAKKQPMDQYIDCSAVAVVTLEAGPGTCVGKTASRKESMVTVNLRDSQIVPWVVLAQARTIAARMFSVAGVRINWRTSQSSGYQV